LVQLRIVDRRYHRPLGYDIKYQGSERDIWIEKRFEWTTLDNLIPFQRALWLMDATTNVVDHRKINRSAMNRLCIKGRKSIWDGVFATDLGLGISRNLFIESLSVKTHRGWKMTYMDG
jgi:hypothetical protein